jgi:hypothetical protein
MEKHNEDISTLIELYALGELDDDKISVVEEHLRHHPEAQAEVQEIRRITAAIVSRGYSEPTIKLSDATKSAVYAQMKHDSQRVIIPFVRKVGRVFTRPAFAAAAALITISICLVLIFNPNKPKQNTIVQNGKESVKGIGAAATVLTEFSEYVVHSADFFSTVIKQDSDTFKTTLDIRRIDIEIGNAMTLLEKKDISENPAHSALVSDIEAIWKDIKGFAAGGEGITFESIKEEIGEKKIIERAEDVKK